MKFKRDYLIIFMLMGIILPLLCAVVLAHADDDASQMNQGLSHIDAYPAKSTIIMQGNTLNADDCLAFRNALYSSNRGYTSFALKGWQIQNGNAIASSTPVTPSEFLEIKNHVVAYYSGHGSYNGASSYRPILNYRLPKGSANYNSNGTQFDVAQLLRVDGSLWGSTCKISKDDPLRVLVLAACYQLDTKVVQYYARLMDASGVMAIAGYHDEAPAENDDVIAARFIDRALDGESVKSSWSYANTLDSEENWAVLVYKDGLHEYYRLPDFPGNTYPEITRETPIYRYASFLPLSGSIVPYESTSNEICTDNLPLSIAASGAQTREAKEVGVRNFEYESYIDPNQESKVKNYLACCFSDVSFENKIMVDRYVEEEMVDLNEGLMPETKKIVERTYTYYDTYNGIKIVDSYIRASVDSLGVKNARDARKGTMVSMDKEEKKESISICSVDEAVNIVKNAIDSSNQISKVALAYVPEESGEYVLCYEIRTNSGFWYVNVQSGEVVDC